MAILFLVGPGELRAQKYMNKGDKYYDRNLFNEAIPYYQKEIEKGPYQAKMASREKLADCYRLTGRFFEAEEMYEYLMKQNKKRRKPEYFLNYAKSLKSSAKYEEAAEQFRIYIEAVPDDPMGPVFLESCYLAQAWLDEEVDYDVKNISQVNTPQSDFAPVYCGGGLVFSSSREGSEKKFISFSDEIDVTRMDLYFMDLSREQGEYSEIVNLKDLNSYLHDGAPTFSVDGKEVYFSRSITGGKDKKTNSMMNSLQVFHSKKKADGQWEEPRSAFAFNDLSYSVGQPSLSSDGKRIYFISDMPGGYGGTDVYYCDMRESGTWGPPKNLGEEVNTFGHELFPYIHGKDTLYFSSDTHPGMGKLDLFFTVRHGKSWEKVTNLKPPLNSIGNDFGITMNGSQDAGFFSSDRFNGTGAEDIYSFTRPRPMEFMICEDELRIADRELFDGITHKIKEKDAPELEAMVSGKGYFRYPVETGKVYEVVSRKDGFFYNKTYVVMRAGSIPGQAISTIISKNHTLTASRLFNKENETVRLMTDEMQIEEKQTNPSGLVAFETLLDAGPAYHIELFRPEPAQPLAVLEDKPTSEPEATLAEKIQIRGQVKYKHDGSAVDGARILLLEDGFPEQEISTGPAGAFSFNAIPGSTYSVLAVKEGCPHTEKTVPGLLEDDEHELVLMIEKQAESATTTTAFNPIQSSVLIQGSVRDLNSSLPLSGARVYLLEKGFPEQEIESDADGRFKFDAMPGMDYTLLALKKGYFYSTIEIDDDNSIDLPAIEEEKFVGMENMDFNENGYDLSSGSMKELFKLNEFMLINPAVRVEVGAFSQDKLGSDKSRKESQLRAESVCAYLKNNDITQDRVWARGLGSMSNPQATDPGQQQALPSTKVGFKVLGTSQPDVDLESMELAEVAGERQDTVWNIIFSVQIGAYRKTVKSTVVEKYRRSAGYHRFNQFIDNRGLTLFQVGGFIEFGEADRLKEEMLKSGVAEAFVVAYNSDERMSITKARQITNDPLLQETAPLLQANDNINNEKQDERKN